MISLSEAVVVVKVDGQKKLSVSESLMSLVPIAQLMHWRKHLRNLASTSAY